MFVSKGTLESCIRYGALALLNMTCFCVINEYKLLSGGILYEVAFSVLFMNIIVEIIYLFRKIELSKVFARKSVLVSLIVSIAWISSTVGGDEFHFAFLEEKEGAYFAELGGYNNTLQSDLIRAKSFLQNNQFFATYASAQEVVNNTFQPSGTDYIIHVLGDKERQKYLDSFENGNFKYAATIRENYTEWETWAIRANQFFYRELYKNWKPVYANTYEVYWEKNPESTNNILTNGYDLNVTEVDSNTSKITITSDHEINGIADVYIDYELQGNGTRSSKLLLHPELSVSNTLKDSGELELDFNTLRPKSAEYIPVRIVNGYGEVELQAKPTKSTKLVLNDVNCKEIFQSLQTTYRLNM